TNGNSSGFNVTSGKLWLFASGDIGKDDNAITTSVGFIEGVSTHGSVYLENTGPTTVGDVIDSYGGWSFAGIQAAHAVVMRTHSPVTIDEDITSGSQIVVISSDNSSNDNLTVKAGKHLQTTASAGTPLPELEPGEIYYLHNISGSN